MTSGKLLLLRLFNLTLGQTAWGNALLRSGLVHLLIKRRPEGDRYMASSRFFDPRELL
jgi:hypothetical protein